ncbi:MAG TPA: hypothetical protein VJ964_08120, partial [Balneolaceae bacterium]|nr:hypothetical protein [Balneolaceae bacterium]
MSLNRTLNKIITGGIALVLAVFMLSGCSSSDSKIGNDDAAEQTYVPPGKHDTFYSFMSGGWTGNIS